MINDDSKKSVAHSKARHCSKLNYSSNANIYMTRRIKFKILASRVIRLQDKSDSATMQHIYKLKVKSLKNEDLPSVQILI